jgi:hypothetical protein
VNALGEEMTRRFFAAPIALAGILALAGVSTVRADDDCQKRTIHADQSLHDAIKKHGPSSPQAAKYRQELEAARSYCWDHGKRWWDEDGKRWHTEKDWDGHDHEH